MSPRKEGQWAYYLLERDRIAELVCKFMDLLRRNEIVLKVFGRGCENCFHLAQAPNRAATQHEGSLLTRHPK